ncbi:hypothetical protein AC579_7698 [Pseudocercospora musae]|uniref:Uncharacterized protein n=1 Tax=Pseudocercospora musae TaxID=113226 RepID=A0A139ITW0_9PEZI|nr:hypothetical protein AC579_7698 [Pseudocercospora musae]KXT18196.1 hypothetical protein AC579_7698 [Pseudocercospora musae]KXT18198.1 hypothetical protein AC579_7698 [Pseudocercospora musae]KXT18199.1 hypothetical protein AC579_7698 [Pseudocercospora musae]
MRLGVHRHLIILSLHRWEEAVVLVLGLRCREEIDHETPLIEDVDERDDPFNDRGAIVVALVSQHTKRDRETKFNEDEGKLDPERVRKDSLVSVMDSQSLVLCADEDGRYYHRIVHVRIPSGIKDGEKNETCSTDNRSKRSADAQDLFRHVVILPTRILRREE